MTTTLAFQGNLQFQPTSLANAAPIPFGLNLQYTSAESLVLNQATSLTNQPVYLGSITQPKLMLVMVDSGTLNVAWDVGGAHPTVIAANSAPPPADSAFLMFYTWSFPSFGLWLTTTAPVSARIWLFQ